ncbi:hypothetical protein RH915_02625 [Serpentinicella sp. ANB-PHB4]|uniref:hypothetical protein n=1 Tax=Serpentinicella sp. ANB-PHB4 TaxID=3074076 RepID=UPI002856FFD4|nr:hypothetical protein [Serpentinicella sp. ANB-PHB4]MDR5658376.1 hypothetical protein [Serpentinicella sp. ANB-PHB4]
MKKILVIFSLFLVLGLLGACDNGDGQSNQISNNIDSQDKGSSSSEVIDAHEVLFDFILRYESDDEEIPIFQLGTFIDIIWDELNFEGESVANREVQYDFGRYDLQEEIFLTGRVSEDQRTVEALTIRIERTGELNEIFEFELENIPYNDDNAYADSSHAFRVKEGVDRIGEHIKEWNELPVDSEELKDITQKFEIMERQNQNAEIQVNFYFD